MDDKNGSALVAMGFRNSSWSGGFFLKKFLAVLAIAFGIPCLAQESTYRHSISGEIFGLGALGISAQYDYMFKRSSYGFYDARIGVGGWYFNSISDAAITIPHAITYNFGQKHRFFETGIGGTFVNEYYWSWTPYSTPKYFVGAIIGYRSISSKGFQFRIYVNAFLSKGNSVILPYGGIGFGKAFRKK